MKKYAVIGSPIAHSKSPQMHEAGFVDLEIDATFDKIEVNPEDLQEWVKQQFPHFAGVAVTLPHKETIRACVDYETDAAQKVGAINTLQWVDERICGTNTDCIGVLKALQTQVDDLKDKKCLILGAGGASRAAIFALQTAEAKVTLWNRTFDKAESIAEEFGIESIENFEEGFDAFDIIINATSVGLKEWKSLVPESAWTPHQVAFDMVYDPLETKFLNDAAEAGALTITGDLMLLYQALEQFRLWNGIALEPEVMGQAFFLE